jgi:ABC-2 type transport system ATP-binding protein
VLYGFLGPNGAGKTTFIRMALGLIFPSHGAVEVLGEPVYENDRPGPGNAFRRVGAVVEEPAFWKYLSGPKNLEYHARLAGPAADRDARLARIDETLRLVGLEQAGSKKVKAYSQGMRQRLGVAMALLGRPDLLVLDEPTNGLDPQGMREVRLLLRRLADEGTTVFVSSHLLWEVETMCDVVGVLARGRLVAEGPPSKLRAAGDHVRVSVGDPVRAREVVASIDGAQLAAMPEAEAELGEAAWIRVKLSPPTTAPALNAALVQAGVAVAALVPERATLEEVFLSLTEGADAPR